MRIGTAVLVASIALLGCAPSALTSAPAGAGALGCAPSALTSAPAGAGALCFILREIGASAQPVREGDACGERFTPASTFKVPHALIALETGARSGPDDLERWDGKSRGLAAWDQDQTLASAIEHSAVWYFQRTAAKIGRARMAEYLDKLDYGNRLIGDDITDFWLGQPLAISPDEQAEFMRRFVERQLPLRRETMDTVDRLILQRPGTFMRANPIDLDVTWDPKQVQLFGKTGSWDRDGEAIRWVIGHLTSGERRLVYVSLVVAHAELSTEAVTQAMHELRDRKFLQPRAP